MPENPSHYNLIQQFAPYRALQFCVRQDRDTTLGISEVVPLAVLCCVIPRIAARGTRVPSPENCGGQPRVRTMPRSPMQCGAGEFVGDPARPPSYPGPSDQYGPNDLIPRWRDGTGAKSVVSITPLRNLRFRFFGPGSELPNLRIGKIVHLTCDTCAGDLTANIYCVATLADYASPMIHGRDDSSRLVYLVQAHPNERQGLQTATCQCLFKTPVNGAAKRYRFKCSMATNENWRTP